MTGFDPVPPEVVERAKELILNHQPRPNPYPDELGELLCNECATLCAPGQPCYCCLEPEPEPEPEEWDPGPEVDDEGGMSEYRHVYDQDESQWLR